MPGRHEFIHASVTCSAICMQTPIALQLQWQLFLGLTGLINAVTTATDTTIRPSLPWITAETAAI